MFTSYKAAILSFLLFLVGAAYASAPVEVTPDLAVERATAVPGMRLADGVFSDSIRYRAEFDCDSKESAEVAFKSLSKDGEEIARRHGVLVEVVMFSYGPHESIEKDDTEAGAGLLRAGRVTSSHQPNKPAVALTVYWQDLIRK